MATAARDRLIAKCRFFLGSDDILEKLRHFVISDGWKFNREVGDGQSFFLDDTFYRPIYWAFNNVLGSAGNLTYLQLHKITIDMDLVRTVSNLHNLHTVKLSICRVTTHVQQALLSDEVATLWTPVYNLHLLFLLGTEDDDLWYSFLLCPQLRTFAAFRPGPNNMGSLPPPPSQIWGRGSSFGTMERLSISGLYFDMDFVAWLRSFPDKPKLTHLKLSSGPGLEEIEICIILARFGAPLKVLVVDGLAKASFGLFRLIPTQFPGLLGLTLIRRAGTRQLRCRPTIWPHAPWEYARHMGWFTELQHFCWNLASHEPSPTTAALLGFEEGFPDPQSDFLGWKDAYDRENFDDAKWTPVLFALSCPKLQTYSEEQYMTEWEIRRPFNGPISAERISDEHLIGRCKWNTDSGDRWPVIIPGGSSNQ